MKVLFVTYCFGIGQGQVLIGVYKRGLRVALELCDRGHEVFFHCTGRENFHDEVTAAAEERIKFVDWPHDHSTPEATEESRQRLLAGLRETAPDLVVIGEAPLAGTLLEFTLCAAELGIPSVCLDNIYGSDEVGLFCTEYGSIFDGIILTGPSSFYTPAPPPYLLQVPPYMRTSIPKARALLTDQLGLVGKRFLAVLAYDLNVEAMGASILEKLEDSGLEAVFLTHMPDECRDRLRRLPSDVQERLRVVRPLPDDIHFGLVQLSSLVIGKCAYMQLTESLSLQTPFIGVYFQGDFHLQYVPKVCLNFAYSSPDTDADAETVATARRFLAMNPEDMREVHDGELMAPSKAADFLEKVASRPPRDVGGDIESCGIEPGYLRKALAKVHGDGALESVRLARIRNPIDQQVFILVGHFSVDGKKRVERLLLRRFSNVAQTEEDGRRASRPESGRRLYDLAVQERYLLEHYIEEAQMPSIESDDE